MASPTPSTYDGPYPVPDRLLTRWHRKGVTQVHVTVTVSLDVLLDADGRSGIDEHIRHLTGLDITVVSYRMDYPATARIATRRALAGGDGSDDVALTVLVDLPDNPFADSDDTDTYH